MGFALVVISVLIPWGMYSKARGTEWYTVFGFHTSASFYVMAAWAVATFGFLLHFSLDPLLSPFGRFLTIAGSLIMIFTTYNWITNPYRGGFLTGQFPDPLRIILYGAYVCLTGDLLVVIGSTTTPIKIAYEKLLKHVKR